MVIVSMRYVINEKVKSVIRNNYNELARSNLKSKLKNFIYKNKSISAKDIANIVRILDLKGSELGLKEINLDYAKNFGLYSQKARPVFSGKSKEFAEFIGIMLGDGNIFRNSVRIIINRNEKRFGDYITDLFFRLFQMKLSHNFIDNIMVLNKHNENLVNILLKYGLKRGDKMANRVAIPPWIFENEDCIAPCLRGLIDTDGCFYKCKRDGKIYIQFTSHSANLLNDVNRLGGCLGIKFSKAGAHRICIYKMADVKRYIEMVGFSNPNNIDKTGLWCSLVK